MSSWPRNWRCFAVRICIDKVHARGAFRARFRAEIVHIPPSGWHKGSSTVRCACAKHCPGCWAADER